MHYRGRLIECSWLFSGYSLCLKIERYGETPYWSVCFSVDESYDPGEVSDIKTRVGIVLSAMSEFKEMLKLPSLNNAIIVAELEDVEHLSRFLSKLGFKEWPESILGDEYYLINRPSPRVNE